MYDLPATLDRSPAPVLDCKFARTCIYLSFKGLNVRQKLTFEQKCEKVQEEVVKLMSKSTFVPKIPTSVFQQICGELEDLRSSKNQTFTEICEVYSPPAWLALPGTERAAHQLLSRPCYACIQLNHAVYNKFASDPPARSLPTPNGSLPQTKTTTSDGLMSQLRELIKPSVEDSDFFPVPPETSTVMPQSEPEKMSEQEASLLAALTALPSSTLDRMISLLSQPNLKQEVVESETLVCRTSTQSVYHQTPHSTSNEPPKERQFPNQAPPQLDDPPGSINTSRSHGLPPSQRVTEGVGRRNGHPHSPSQLQFQQPARTSPHILVPRLLLDSPTNSPGSSYSGQISAATHSAGGQISDQDHGSATSQTCLIPVSPSPDQPQRIPTCLKADLRQSKSTSPRLKLQDLSNVPESGLWIVRTSKALFELNVGSVINTALIAEKEKAPSRNHVSKLAQILGLERRMVEHQEVLSGFRMFKNSANFDLDFASQIAKVTIHQLLEGSCTDSQLTILCGVISDVIMQAFNLHRDTPPMTVAKIIMIQGSPLLRNTVQLPTSPSNAPSSLSNALPSNGLPSSTSQQKLNRSLSGNKPLSHGGTGTNSRKRRRVHSGASKRSPKLRPSAISSDSGAHSENTADFDETVAKLLDHLSKSTLDLLKTGDNLSYCQVADLASAMTDTFVDTSTNTVSNQNANTLQIISQ